jgi:hypothetical protein
LTCRGFSPPLPGVVKVGTAVSPTFSDGANGPFASQTAFAFRSAGEERVVWSRVVRPGLVRCVAEGFAHSSGGGVTFSVVRSRLVAAPRVGVRAAAYLVQGTATTAGQTVDVYLETVMLGAGRVISALSVTTFFDPVDNRTALRLARAVARRVSRS